MKVKMRYIKGDAIDTDVIVYNKLITVVRFGRYITGYYEVDSMKFINSNLLSPLSRDLTYKEIYDNIEGLTQEELRYYLRKTIKEVLK